MAPQEYLAIANEGDTKEYELTADVEWTEEADAPDIADAVNASLPAFFAEPVSAAVPMTLAEALAGTLEDLTVSEVDGGPRSIAGEAVTAFEKVRSGIRMRALHMSAYACMASVCACILIHSPRSRQAMTTGAHAVDARSK